MGSEYRHKSQITFDTARNDVHFVVTEYGVASLYGRTVRQRVRELIAIAHPAFRDELTCAAQKLGYL